MSQEELSRLAAAVVLDLDESGEEQEHSRERKGESTDRAHAQPNHAQAKYQGQDATVLLCDPIVQSEDHSHNRHDENAEVHVVTFRL